MPSKHTKRAKRPQTTTAKTSPIFLTLSTRLFGVEDTGNALGDNGLILVGASTASGDLGKNIVGSKHTGRPTSPAEVDVRVGHEVVKHIADGSEARLVVGATGLGQQGLAAVAAEPRSELGEACNVGGRGNAGVVCAAVVRVRVLVNVEDEVGLAAVEVGDLVEGGSGAVVDKQRRVCPGKRVNCSLYLVIYGPGNIPVVSGKKNHVLGGSCLADGGNSGLDGGSPGVDVLEVVGLVHDGEGNLGLASILAGELRPKT